MSGIDFRQHFLAERQIGDELPQPRILLLQLPELAHFRWHQPTVDLLPSEERCRADAELAAESSTGMQPSACCRANASAVL